MSTLAILGGLFVFAALQAVYWRVAARRAGSVALLRSRLHLGNQQELLVRARTQEDSLAILLTQSGLGWTKGSFTRRVAVAAAIGGALGGLRGGFVGVLIVGALAAGGVYYYLIFTRDRRLQKVAEQMPRALELMTLTLRAGHALPRAVDVVSSEIPAPLGQELRRVADETALGRPIEESFAAMNRRLPGVPPLRALVTGIAVLGRSGGNLIEVIDRVIEYSAQQAQFQRRVRALTAESRSSAFILGALPPAFGVLASFVGRGYLNSLVTDPLGRTMGIAAVSFWLLGVIWIRRLSKLEA